MDNLEKELRVLAQSYREGYLTARMFRAAIVPVLVNDACYWHDNTHAQYLASAFLGELVPMVPNNPVAALKQGGEDGTGV